MTLTDCRSAAVGAALFLGIPYSVHAITVDGVIEKLEANARNISSIELVIDHEAIKTLKDGTISQRISSRKHFWCDKASQMVRIEIVSGSGDNQLWDGQTRRVTSKNLKTGALSMEDFPGFVTVTDGLWPGPKYIYFPRFNLAPYNNSLIKEQGNQVTLASEPKGSDASKENRAHIQYDIDLSRGVFTEVRCVSANGNVVSKIELKRIRQFGECWLPTYILETSYAKKCTVTFEYFFDEVIVNKVTSKELKLQ